VWRYVKPFRYNTGTWQTDGRTDEQNNCYINIARNKLQIAHFDKLMHLWNQLSYLFCQLAICIARSLIRLWNVAKDFVAHNNNRKCDCANFVLWTVDVSNVNQAVFIGPICVGCRRHSVCRPSNCAPCVHTSKTEPGRPIVTLEHCTAVGTADSIAHFSGKYNQPVTQAWPQR